MLNERYERSKIFDKGQVPSVDRKHPLSGNMFEVIAPFHNLQVIDSYHAKLGKTFGLFYGPDPWVFSTDGDLLHRVFVQDGSKNIDITQFRMPFMDELNNSLSQLRGDQWRSVRRLFNPSFAPHQMKSDNVYEDIDKACSRALNCVSGHPVEDAGRIVDVLSLFKRFSADVIFRVAYGRDDAINMEPKGKDVLIETMDQAAKMVRGPIAWASVMFDSMQHFIGLFSHLSPLGRCVKLIHEVLDESLKLRRVAHLELDKRNRKMIDTFIESMQTNKISEKLIKANLFFIFIAGFETTANTLAIMFWLLAKYPDYQDRLRESLLQDGEQSSYMEWVIQETLRLHPAVPTAIGRILSEPLEHNGMTFFPGTTINASIWSLHRCQHYWGSDSHQFRPERFRDAKLHPAQYFAFGIGPRYCLGMSMALAEIRAILPKLLLRYRIESCAGTPAELDMTSPNLIHMIIEGQIELKFVELSSI